MDFYYSIRSPFCRSVIMAAEALGVKLNRIVLDTGKQEHLKPEFLKLNPQHTIPTVVDNGLVLWESRAILQYMVEKYGKEDDPLYPKCVKKRAVINQRLYFDMGTLIVAMGEYYVPIWRHKQEPDAGKYKKLEDAFNYLNIFLEGHSYVAGDNMTIADISLVAGISTIDVFGFNFSKFPNVAKWYENMKKTVPGWKENWEGCLALKTAMQSM